MLTTKNTLKIHRVRNPHLALIASVLYLSLAFVNSDAFAATQGQWGSTSTATAKITLTIHPYQNSDNPVVHSQHTADGAERLAVAINTILNDTNNTASCNQWVGTKEGQYTQLIEIGGYHLSLISASTDQSLRDALQTHCGKFIDNTLDRTEFRSYPFAIFPVKAATTLLIAPL